MSGVISFENINPFVRHIGLGIGGERLLVTKTEARFYHQSARAFAEYERALGRSTDESPALKALRKKYLG